MSRIFFILRFFKIFLYFTSLKVCDHPRSGFKRNGGERNLSHESLYMKNLACPNMYPKLHQWVFPMIF